VDFEMTRPQKVLWLLFSSLFLISSANSAGAWQKIQPYHFGRYPVPPSVYGFRLDDPGPDYYGGSRYKEYYHFGRGYALADFPGPVPEFAHGHWFRHKYWPYGSAKLPKADNGGGPDCACIVVHVPAGAQVWLEGKPTTQSGSTRTFVSPPLPPKQNFVYQVRVRWKGDAGVTEQSQNVVVQSGSEVQLHFPLPSATEKVSQTIHLQPVPNQAP
jgi:uncharacterized protein (TIGR03000 family)